MSILDNIEYKQNFQDAYVKQNCVTSPLKEYIQNKYKAIDFTKNVFNLMPMLFPNGSGSSLFYIDCAGQEIKNSILYTEFETFISYSNRKIIEAQINNLNPFGVDCESSIIQWARYIKLTRKLPEFEPVIKYCREVLRTLLERKEFLYKEKVLTFASVHAICYTNVGENIINLLPYIACLYNFLINCKHYIFSEVTSGSMYNAFLDSINNRFEAYYTKLLTNTNSMSLQQLFSSPDKITQIFSKELLSKMFSEMCHPEDIIEIRNRIIINNPELGDCSNEQLSVSKDDVTNGFYSVFSNLMDIVIENNPITKLLKRIPNFDSSYLPSYELSMLTQYCLSGGVSPFSVNPDNTYSGSGDAGSLLKYMDEIPNQKLITGIRKLNIVDSRPFISANFPLEITTGYLKQKFENIQTDILNDEIITIDEKFIQTEIYGTQRMEEILVGLYVNGKWLNDNSSMHNIFKILKNNKEFYYEIIDILNISLVLSMFFENKFGTKIIPAYILSFMNEWLLKFMCRDKFSNINKFSPIIYFCLNHKYDEAKIKKLIDMEISIMYLYNTSYVSFINTNAREFGKMLIFNSYIQQPYVKSISDNVDIYAIGGCELVEKAQGANPIYRGYWFVHNTQGICENLEVFYNWTKYIINTNDNIMFNVLTHSMRDKDWNVIKKILISNFNTLISNNNIPLMLSNFIINEDGTYKLKTYPYFMDLETSDGNTILSVISKFTFPASFANHVMSQTLYFKPIIYKNGVFLAGDSLENHIKYGKNIEPATLDSTTPYYNIMYFDFNADFKDFNIAFPTPPKMKNLIIYTDNGRRQKNNVFFLFTPLDTITFNKKYKNSFNNIFESSLPEDSELPSSRMQIMGLTLNTVPNVSGNASK